MAEVKLRRSKQRDSIYAILKDNHNHPCVDEIYLEARKIMPDISLGTVYRNLNVLVDLNMVRKIETGSYAHYDGDMHPHFHMFCEKCGNITDIPMDMELVKQIEINAESLTQASISTTDILFNGICKSCLKETQN